MKIFLTGSTGLVGGEILDYLISKKINVVCGNRKSNSIVSSPYVKNIPFDLNDCNLDKKIINEIKGCNGIIHCGAQIPTAEVSFSDSGLFFKTNSLGTETLLKYAIKSKIKKFIYISTISVLESEPRPIKEENNFNLSNSYASSKVFGEMFCNYYAREENLQVTTLRISAPYGNNRHQRGVIYTFLDRIQNSKDIELWSQGKRQQVFTHTKDIARACLLSLESSYRGTLNITGPDSISMFDLANLIIEETQSKSSRIILSDKIDPQANQQKSVSLVKSFDKINYEPKYNLPTGLRQVLKNLKRIN